MPNPTSSAILRAGGRVDDWATVYRKDLAYALNSGVGKNPNTLLTNRLNPTAAAYALAAQGQIATIFVSGGLTVTNPTVRRRSSRGPSKAHSLRA